MCDSIASLDPHPYIPVETAWAILWSYLGGNMPGDQPVEAGSLSVIPVSNQAVLAGQLVASGTGLDYRLVYRLAFRRSGHVGTWAAQVDAHTGELLSFTDANKYGHVQGGVRKSDGLPLPVTVPFPYVDISTSGAYADALGNFNGTTGISTMKGTYLEVNSGLGDAEGCDPNSDEEIWLSTSTGLLDFGSTSGSGCDTPGFGGPGNTNAARTNYWNLTEMKLHAKKYDSGNDWINFPLLDFVHRLYTGDPACNAMWAHASKVGKLPDPPDPPDLPETDYLNFFISDSTGCPGDYRKCCGNSGEFPGIIIHEFGHGLDAYDGSWTATSIPMPDNLPIETRADWTAILHTHDSCPGRGFLLTDTFHGYGNRMTSCTGFRDVDYKLRNVPQPWSPQNYYINYADQNGVWGKWLDLQGETKTCDEGDYFGPCGWEDHCESVLATQALWDFVNRDLVGPPSNMDLPTAWQLAERLMYTEMANSLDMYSCDSAVTPVMSDGCAESVSLYGRMRHADDCDGNLLNGTPHAAAIFAALNRHGIACGNAADGTNQNQDPTTCSDPNCLSWGKPSVYGSSNSCWNYLEWDVVPGAARYFINRNETGCDMGYTKIATVTSPAFTDTLVYEEATYYYRVQAAGSGDVCVGPVSACVAVTTSCAPQCTPLSPPTLNSAAGTCTGVSLSWAKGSGTTLAYNVYRKNAPCGSGYAKIAGPITNTTYEDNTGEPGTQYAYVIKGACDYGGTSLSGYSNCITATRFVAPAVPGVPTVEDVCDGIKVTWAGIPSATYYKLYRREGACGADAWSSILVAGPTVTTWTDTTAMPGGSYGYYLEAGNADCLSANMANCATATHAAPDISGRVSETKHVKNSNGIWVALPPDYIDKAIVEILDQSEYPPVSTGPSQQHPEWIQGEYKFIDVEGTSAGYPFKVHAYKWVNVEGIDYQVGYNPLPYRSVSVCKADRPDQNFNLPIYVMPFNGGMKGPIMQGYPGVIAGWTVTAVSTNYWTTGTTAETGAFNMLLPEGNYKVYMNKQCYTSYPPYLAATVADQPIVNQNFQISGWQTCAQCYPSLYDGQRRCRDLIIGREECEVGVVRAFQGCAVAKTAQANSALYNAILLSVEIQRSSGQPAEDVSTFTVGAEGDYWINISNGDYFNKDTAVSSAEISMAPFGSLFGPSDFNKNVFLLKKQVHLTPGDYSISSILRSQPGSYLTIVISNLDIASFPELP